MVLNKINMIMFNENYTKLISFQLLLDIWLSKQLYSSA